MSEEDNDDTLVAPLYQAIHHLRAAQIKNVQSYTSGLRSGRGRVTLANDQVVEVDGDWMRAHAATAGDYLTIDREGNYGHKRREEFERDYQLADPGAWDGEGEDANQPAE